MLVPLLLASASARTALNVFISTHTYIHTIEASTAAPDLTSPRSSAAPAGRPAQTQKTHKHSLPLPACAAQRDGFGRSLGKFRARFRAKFRKVLESFGRNFGKFRAKFRAYVRPFSFFPCAAPPGRWYMYHSCAQAGRVPLSAGRVPLTAGRVPLSAGRVPLSAGRVPLTARRVPLSLGRVPLTAGRVPLSARRVPLSAGRVPLSAGPFLLSAAL